MSHYLTLRGVGQPIAYFPKLGVYLGNVKAAILLGQFIYWHDKTDNPLGIFKSSEEIQNETGLTYREQVTARKTLVAEGLISETEKRIEHRIYFKFHQDNFDAWLDAKINQVIDFKPNDKSAVREQQKRISWDDENAVRESPKAHFVIHKNTTENTNNTLSKDWQPKKENLVEIIRLKLGVQTEQALANIEYHLGNFNAHWENKTLLTENQKHRKFAAWLISEFEKAQRPPKAPFQKQPYQRRFGNPQQPAMRDIVGEQS